MTISEELSAAAALIRATAAKATPGTWINLDRGDRIIADAGNFGRPAYVVDEPLVANPDNGAHIALWDPDIAELAAKMLDDSAHWAKDLTWEPELEKTFEHELALARAINAKGGAV